MYPEVVYQQILERLHTAPTRRVEPVSDRQARQRLWRSGIDRMRGAMLLRSSSEHLTLHDLHAERSADEKPAPAGDPSWCRKLRKQLQTPRRPQPAQDSRPAQEAMPRPAAAQQPAHVQAPLNRIRPTVLPGQASRPIAQVHAPSMSSMCTSTPSAAVVQPATPAFPGVTLGVGALSPPVRGSCRPRFGS